MFQLLAQVLSEIKDRVDSAERVNLFLDFDGTAVPISTDFSAPRLSPRVAETLEHLARGGWAVTTIISGRAVEDLYGRIRLDGLIYAGNHGLEIFGRNLRFVEPAASARREQLARLCEDLGDSLEEVPGVVVEYKGLTASVHYRQADLPDLPRIEPAVRSAVALAGDLFRVSPGRKVFEILPRTSWHKGCAVRWIVRNLDRGAKSVSIYLGDDTSDEDAFNAMPDAITIKVGKASATCARYQLPDPTAVHGFLTWLAIQEGKS